MGNQIKKYIITEEYLIQLLTSHMETIALHKAGLGDWPYYTVALSDFMIDCGKQDNKTYFSMNEIVENELSKLEPIKEGDKIWDTVDLLRLQ